MVNITLSISNELKKTMKEFSDVNWSGLVRISIEEKIKQLKWKKEMLEELKKERDFEDWTINMGRKINEDITKRLKNKKII